MLFSNLSSKISKIIFHQIKPLNISYLNRRGKVVREKLFWTTLHGSLSLLEVTFQSSDLLSISFWFSTPICLENFQSLRPPSPPHLLQGHSVSQFAIQNPHKGLFSSVSRGRQFGRRQSPSCSALASGTRGAGCG